MKFIGITQRLLENTSYYEVREALSVEWGDFFKEHLQGFLPLPLSYAMPFSAYVESLGDLLAGVILSGGNDLSSLNPNPLSAMRDEYEAQILTHCLQHNVPLLGICRGAQRIAEYFGAKLELLEGHIGTHKVLMKSFACHFEALAEESKNLIESKNMEHLRDSSVVPLLQNDRNGKGDKNAESQIRFLVNSFHNYGIMSLGDELMPLAVAEDSTIEAFKHRESHIFGIMWHIEREGGMEDSAIFRQYLRDLKERK